MNTAKAARNYFARDERFLSLHGKFKNFVQVSMQKRTLSTQFSDISATGMRLISRHPAKLQVGELISVEFSLPNQTTRIKRQAYVVRKTTDFDFAVRFTKSDSENELRNAVYAYGSFVKRGVISDFFDGLRTWIVDHKQGLIASVSGLAIMFGIATVIYSQSDEHRGSTIRSWAGK